MSDQQTSFGTLLKRYRMAAGLTQEALAASAGLSARTIADLERGVNRLPRHDTFELLMTALNVTSQQRALLLAIARPEMAEAAARRASPSRSSASSHRIDRTRTGVDTGSKPAAEAMEYAYLRLPDLPASAKPGSGCKSPENWRHTSPRESRLSRLQPCARHNTCRL